MPPSNELASIQRGAYSDSLVFTIFVNFMESKWPGSGQLIRAAAEVIPWDKLVQAIQLAVADWQAGKDFLTMLKDTLSVFIDFVPASDGSDSYNLVAKCE